MLPVLFRVLSRYAPYITLPFACVIGIIGYNLENYMTDKHTPFSNSIAKNREERILSGDTTTEGSLKEKKFVPATVFEKNLSPSLQEK